MAIRAPSELKRSDSVTWVCEQCRSIKEMPSHLKSMFLWIQQHNFLYFLTFQSLFCEIEIPANTFPVKISPPWPNWRLHWFLSSGEPAHKTFMAVSPPASNLEIQIVNIFRNLSKCSTFIQMRARLCKIYRRWKSPFPYNFIHVFCDSDT